jgi:hypothetical protein
VTTTLDNPPVGRGKTGSPLVLNIVLEPGDDAAPLRVLSLLARRRCRILRAAFAMAEPPALPELRLEITTPAGREATVERWVAGLVAVREVTRELA